MSFDVFAFSSTISANLRALDYQDPTPIQRQAIPEVMAGKDLIGLAQTGTGKTAAFLLPIIERLLATLPVNAAPHIPSSRPVSGARGHGRQDYRPIGGLVIAPTRELAEQIKEVAVSFLKGTPLRVATIYGGVSMRPQVEKLRAGVDLVIACPGRLLDHMESRTVDLRSVKYLVLDEADQMFDMGFLPNIRRILQVLPRNRQTMLFSATMPQEIKRLAIEILRDPVTVQVGTTAPVATVSHALYPVPQHLKTSLLINLLRSFPSESVLVFTRTKHRAKRLETMLQREKFGVAALHGNLSQNKRQLSMNEFRSGKVQILVATDIAARGVDISTITHVINYDIPNTTDAYTHRIGRTGRAQKTGDALTFVAREDEGMVRQIERVLRARIERKVLAGFNYKAQPDPAVVQQERSERRNDFRPRSSSSRTNNSTPRGGRSTSNAGYQPRARYG